MATNLNNIHINSFSKGMNTDTSLDMVGNELYVFGLNIRITANALLKGAIDSNSKEGIVTPVLSGQLNHGSFALKLDPNSDELTPVEYSSILAIATLEDIGAIVVKNADETWSVYRIDYNKHDDSLSFKNIFNSDETTDRDKFSVVINKETDKLVKLYIADGKHEIMTINIHEDQDDYNQNDLKGNPDYLRNNRFFPQDKVHIGARIAGTLKTGQIQYTYRLYKKNGVSSKLAPLTNKIQVIDPSRYKEIGNAEDTQTTVGFQLKIYIDPQAADVFDHLQIYRLEYTKPNTDASVFLIYDAKFSGDQVKINDNGLDPIQELSIQEFAALNTIDIIPKCIEQNQNYMFAANIKDETSIRVGKSEDGNEVVFDARAYSFAEDGKIYLYQNNDTTYNWVVKGFDDASDVTDDYTLNKYSDMTIDAEYSPQEGVCKYYKAEDGALFLGGNGKNVSWRFVTTDIPLDTILQDTGQMPPRVSQSEPQYMSYLMKDGNGLSKAHSLINTESYFRQHGIDITPSLSYDDLFTSSLLRSLRRDEVYRYGIVLYDKYGRRSDTLWIADIRTPSEEEYPSTSSTKTEQPSSYTDTWAPMLSMSKYKYDDHLFYQQDQLRIDCDYKSKDYYVTPQSSYTATLDANTTLCSGLILFSKQSLMYDTDVTPVQIAFEDVPYSDLETYLMELATAAGVYGLDLWGCILVEIYPYITFDRYATAVNALVKKATVTVTLTYSGANEYEYVNIVNFDIHPKFKVKIDAPVAGTNEIREQLYARPLGIEFEVKNLPPEISYYQIVRCAKTASYTKNLMQCATARPVRQGIENTNASGNSISNRYTPYYPTPFLTSDYMRGTYYFEYDPAYPFLYTNEDNQELFLIFSPEIQVVLDDALIKLQSFISKVLPLYYAYGEKLRTTNYRLSFNTPDTYYTDGQNTSLDWHYSPIYVGVLGNPRQDLWNGFYYDRPATKGTDYSTDDDTIYNYFDEHSHQNIKAKQFNYPKEKLSFIFKNYSRSPIKDVAPREIEGIDNVTNPNWEEGFSNIQLNGDTILTGVKQYKSFTTSINKHEYVNWVCNGMYDLRISSNISANYRRKNGRSSSVGDGGGGLSVMIEPKNSGWFREAEAKGWIGPGPRCFLMSIKNSSKEYPSKINYGPELYQQTFEDYKAFMSRMNPFEDLPISTCIVNIQHVPSQYAGLTNEEKQYDVYYGFGNTSEYIQNGGLSSLTVFDGDVYITPCEITSMYKTYDFNSYDTIPSAQFIYYVPLESTINTYFDYGMGYRNTQSGAVMIEPGEISGVRTQARPEHQYNIIYSDNNVSNDVYNVQSLEDSTQTFPQRIHYSVLKTNGELIDNWQMFKALDYIDADTRYGLITNLLTSRDTIYFWQDQAFGKLSVNERSLVTDNNSNTVQLGQGGVLQRSDYINTRYGMRDLDHSAISAEGSIYWIDIINKAILMSNGLNVINLGEQLNVLNCINQLIVEDIPTIHYDIQNNELLCKCLENGRLMVFNIKLNIATAVYDRHYEDSIMFNNVLFGVLNNEIRKYNYIQGEPEYDGITSRLEFVVNNSASTTKVFDNQEIVTLARGSYKDETAEDNYFANKYFTFTTNIINETQKNPVGYTDREGNVRYAIPRYNGDYGNRMRGKWLKVDIEDQEPKYEHSISHILTKFRQSFS